MTLVSNVEKVRRSIARTESILLTTVAVVAICSGLARSQTATPQTVSSTTDESASESLKNLDRLIEQNSQLEKQNKELMDQIGSLRRVLAKQAGGEAETTAHDSEQGEEPKATAKLTSGEQPDKW